MYTEEEKNMVRRKVFYEAIDILTHNRKDSTIASVEYFDSVEEFMLNDSWHESDYSLASQLEDTTKASWKKHFDSVLSSKNGDEIRVAYLAGPNPENDIQELCKLGVLPENIWAFESENRIYDEAVNNLLRVYPQVKIHRGKISAFFDQSAINFDVVYLDFCGAFITSNKKNKNISTIISLLDNHRLNSPGVLITNFAFIDNDNDIEMKKLITKIVSMYLYPKAYADDGLSAEEQGLGFYEWYKKVEFNLDYYYCEFIRRFMMDLTSVIVPFMRIVRSKEYFNIFFDLDKRKLDLCKRNLFYYNDDVDLSEEVSFKLEVDCGGYLASEMSFFSIPWFIEMVRCEDVEALKSFDYNNKNEDESLNNFYTDFYDDKFIQSARNIVNQLSNGSDEHLDKFCVILYLILSESYGKECYSTKLKKISNMNWNRIAPQACDVFTFQSVIGLLLGQLSVPYHINVLKSQGISYKAKKTKMYTDLFVLDECRYIYDMLPTIDMIINRMENISSQICYRFALDALDKNHIRYNSELFYGCAVVGCNHKGFEDRWFHERECIT